MAAPSPVDLATNLFGSVLEVGPSTETGPLTLVRLYGSIPAPDYLLAQDADARGMLRVTEIGAGIVGRILIWNRADLPVLLLDADHLEGAKQDRIAAATALIPANSKTGVPVTCVERGRWSRTSDAFRVSPHTAVTLARQYNLVGVGASLRATGSHVGDQRGVWSRSTEGAR